MNLEKFSSASQDELITWASEQADSFADGELDLADETSAPSEELIYALSVYKLLAEQNLRMKNTNFLDFATKAEAELRRRNKS